MVPGGGIGNGTAYWSLDTAPYPAGEIAGFFPPSVFLSRWRGERAEGAEVGVEGGGKRLVFFWIVVEEGGTGHRGGKIGRPKFAWKNPYKVGVPRRKQVKSRAFITNYSFLTDFHENFLSQGKFQFFYFPAVGLKALGPPVPADPCAWCSANSVCNSTPSPATCTCNAGYHGNGTTCDPLRVPPPSPEARRSHAIPGFVPFPCIGNRNPVFHFLFKTFSISKF